MRIEDRDLAMLASADLFKGVDARELARALEGSAAAIHEFAAGRVVLLAGCAYVDLRIILEGDASADMVSAEGKSVVVENLGAGQAVATAVLFSPGSRLPVTLVANSMLRVAVLPRALLLSLCGEFPALLEALLFDMGQRLAFLADKYRNLSFATLRERLADWLLRSAQRKPEGLEVRLQTSKERLSAVFGVARPSLSRELGELESRKLIEVRGRSILIRNEEGLRSLRPR